MAIPREHGTEPELVALTRNAPAKIAGQTRMPKRSRLPKAIPLGGQTAETLPLSSANESPSLPLRK